MAHNYDLYFWQRWVDVAPHFVWVIDQFAVFIWNLLGHGHKNLLAGYGHHRAAFGICEGQTVITDRELAYFFNAVLVAIFQLRLLHGA